MIRKVGQNEGNSDTDTITATKEMCIRDRCNTRNKIILVTKITELCYIRHLNNI